jgi:ankyrin repeat protein
MSSSAGFFEAVAAGDLAVVRRLLGEHPRLISATSPDGASPALVALYAGQPRLADELAAHAGELSEFEAAAFDDTARLEALIRADRSVVGNWSPDGWQPLHLAAYFGRAESARILLDADAPVGLASRNAMAVYPLHAAAAGRHAELIWLLIASDAPVNATQPGGTTALMSAAANGDLDSVRALLAAGAEPQLRDDDGRTARDLCSESEIIGLLS